MIRTHRVRPCRGERGAVMPEYALIVALIVVATIGVIVSVADRGEDRLEGSDARIGLPADAANYSGGATTTTIQSSTTTTAVSGQTVRVGTLTKAPNPSQGSPASKWIANVTIEARDGTNALVAGVVVTGSWSSNGSGQAGTCTTGVTGTCSVQRIDLEDSAPTETFTVTNMAKSGYTFDNTGTLSLAVACNPPLTTGCD